MHTNTIQIANAEQFLIRVAFTGYQDTASAIAKLRQNDQQEVFRELEIYDAILSLAIDNPQLVSKDYVQYTIENQMMSSQQILMNVSN